MKHWALEIPRVRSENKSLKLSRSNICVGVESQVISSDHISS